MDTIKDNLNTKVFLLLSENDHLWNDHFVPLIEKLTSKKIKFIYKNELRATCHSDISYFFPTFIKEQLLNIISDDEVTFPEVLETSEGKLDIRFRNPNQECYWAFEINPIYNSYLISKNDHVLEYDFSNLKNEIIEFSVVAKFFFKNQKIYQDIICNKIIPQSALRLTGYEFHVKAHSLRFKIILDTTIDCQYAFYLYEDSERIKIVPYSKNKECEFLIKDGKQYKIVYFIRTPSDIRIIRNSEKIITNGEDFGPIQIKIK